MIFIIVLTIVGVVGFIVIYSLLAANQKETFSNLKDRINYLQDGFTNQGRLETRDQSEGFVTSIINSLGAFLPVPTPEKLELLNQAGHRSENAYPMLLQKQIGFVVLGAAVGGLLGIAMESNALAFLLFFACGILGYFISWSSLKGEVAHRSLCIDKTIPDLVDLFANACSAGTSFDLAADFILNELPEHGTALPIKQDFLAWQQDTKFGVERTECWTRLRKRSQSKNIKYFANLMDQSEKTGGSVSEALLKMADFFRERRKQQIEADISQLASKLAGLTILFIVLPILLLIIIPIGLQIKKQSAGIF